MTRQEGFSNVRVTVISSETPGRRMAGPAIRALNLALQLYAFGYSVTLATPEHPQIDIPVRTIALGKATASSLRSLGDVSDLIITQPTRVDLARGLHDSSAPVIYDLYVPAFVEYPESLALTSFSRRTRTKLVERNRLEYATAVNCGDAFLVASERQKDFIIGALGQAGRMQALGPGGALLPEVEVIPFGISQPRHRRDSLHPFKGSLVPDDSIVMLWTGGLWNWFDPGTVIRGLVEARQEDPRLRLIFLGAKNPYGSETEQSRASAVFAEPEIQAVFNDGGVFFASDWVDYEDRYDYLADADIGVSAHFNTFETRMSFRTRLLDHLWVGLPTLTTSGGVLAEQMEHRGAAICVPPKSVTHWTSALVGLAGDPAKRQLMSDNALELASEYRWPVTTKPLTRLIPELTGSEQISRSGPSAIDTFKYLLVALENRMHRNG